MRGRFRCLAVLLASSLGCALFASAPAAADSMTYEGGQNLLLIGEALEEDPVHVVEGEEEYFDEEVVDRIREHVENGPRDVYVVIGDVRGVPSVSTRMESTSGLPGLHFHLSAEPLAVGAPGDAERAVELAELNARAEGERPSQEEILARAVELVQRENFEEEYDAARGPVVTIEHRYRGPGDRETLSGATHVMWAGGVLMSVAFVAGLYVKLQKVLEHRRVRLN